MRDQLVLEDKPHYGYFQALYLSFYSSKLYIDAGKRWKGFGIIYLLLVIALLSIPFSIRLTLDFAHYFNHRIIEPIQNLPEIYIQNGNVVFDKPMPYFIKDDAGEVVSIIDTTGTVNKIDDAWPRLMFLLTKDTMFLRVPNIKLSWLTIVTQSEPEEIYSQKIYPGTNELFNAKDWIQNGGVGTLKYFGEFLIYPMAISMFASIILLTLPIFGLLGQLFSRVLFSWPLHFGQACRLMALGMTAPLLLFFILLTANWLKTGTGFILLIILILYFCMGVVALKNSSKQVART